MRTRTGITPFRTLLSLFVLTVVTACGEEPVDIVTTEPPEPDVAPGLEKVNASVDAYFEHLELTGALRGDSADLRRASLDFIDRHFADDPEARAAALESFHRASEGDSFPRSGAESPSPGVQNALDEIDAAVAGTGDVATFCRWATRKRITLTSAPWTVQERQAVRLYLDVQERGFEAIAPRGTVLLREDEGLLPCVLGVVGDSLRAGLMGAGVGGGLGLAGGPVGVGLGAGGGGFIGLLAGAMSGAADHC